MANVDRELLNEILLGHPSVSSAVIVTLPGPDTDVVVGVAEVGEFCSSPVLREYVNDRSAGQDRLDAVLVVDQVPVRDGDIDIEGIRRDVADQAESIIYAQPSTDTERILTDMWQSTLTLPRVGVNDDFLDLGGDSLAATALLYDINERFGVDLDITDLTDAASIRRLGRIIDEPRIEATE